MFIDEVEITVKAGNGGNGAVSFYPGRKTGPDGGPGGDGGDVYARFNPSMSNLNRYQKIKSFKAGNAKSGLSFNKTGADGEDLFLDMPDSTEFTDVLTGYKFELSRSHPEVQLARGGIGGRGNNAFKSSTNVAPHFGEPGRPGEEKRYMVRMRLIADFGLIGLPNVGKSSLLNELTRANVKTANYEFTTLTPNLGVYAGKVIADIPGLIEGAHQGRGLGIKFLKHIEKIPVLLHCIAADSKDPLKDYETVRQELASFNQVLTEKKEIILITRHDNVTPREVEKRKQLLEPLGREIHVVSIHDWDSIKNLAEMIARS